jgi:hypothetical protein
VLLVIAWILITGGATVHLLGARISVRSAANPIAAAWLLLMTWLVLPRIMRARLSLDSPTIRRGLMAGVAAVAVAGRVIATPTPCVPQPRQVT